MRGKLFDMFCVSEAKRAMEKPNVEGTSEHLILFYPFARGVRGWGVQDGMGKGMAGSAGD